jgi:hypothetical protein
MAAVAAAAMVVEAITILATEHANDLRSALVSRP